MAMKLLSFDNQFVAYVDADEQQHDVFVLAANIVQHAKTLNTKLELSEGIWSQLADGPRGHRRLLGQPGGDRRLDNPPIVRREGPKLLRRNLGDPDAIWHARQRHGLRTAVHSSGSAVHIRPYTL
jgi:hypothetical protein